MPPRKPAINLPEHVHAVRAKGRTYTYYQPNRNAKVKGARIRIHGEPLSAEWWANYQLVTGTPRPKPKNGTFAAVMEEWHASPEWNELAAKTREEWTRYCERILGVWGPLEVSGIEPRHVLKLRDAYENTPAAANNLLRCLSSMIAWSIPRGYRTDNPCRGVRKLKGGDPYEPWPWDVIDIVKSKARPDVWSVVALALYTGQRLGDTLKMRRDAVQHGLISVKQEKTSKRLLIPIHRELRPTIESIDHDAMTILASTKGTPWTRDGFQTTWNKRRPQIIRDQRLVFHGLRKTSVIALLEAGCTDAQVASISGHSREMVEHYSVQVNQEKLAREAMRMWENGT